MGTNWVSLFQSRNHATLFHLAETKEFSIKLFDAGNEMAQPASAKLVTKSVLIFSPVA